jgi:DNA polymerase-3 subunit gamma/tau
MAAMLRQFYKILDVEGTVEQPVVVIQSEKQAHYKYVKEEDRYKILEWALTTEFGMPCLVRLVPPGQPFSATPIPDSVTYSTSAAPVGAPQQPALRERPVLPPDEETPDARMQKSLSQSNQSSYPSDPSDAMPLARMGNMKENITGVGPQDTIEQKVRRDPVVQEVMKTFSARIVEVYPK